MKKKYLNKSIVALLLTAFLMIIVSTLYTGFMAVYADSQYMQDYTQLTDEELDDLSARTTESDEAPQITVFTHGYGGNAGHWSNGISNGEGEAFAYEQDSMIEQLRESIEAKDKPVTMFVAQVGENSDDKELITIEKAQSEMLNIASTNDLVGSAQLRCLYSDDTLMLSEEVSLYRNDVIVMILKIMLIEKHI